MSLPSDDAVPARPSRASALLDLGAAALLTAVALTVALYDLHGSGPLWYDSPRYSNAGAMVHDWLRSGEWDSPYAFAQKNYQQYPAFSIPYHPPGYPLALGLLFWVTGVSYTGARVFVAACAAVCGVFAYAFSRRLGAGRGPSLAAALLMLTTPELARWSRDMMSEVPGLAVMCVATWFFLRWLDGGRRADAGLAFGLAFVAFLFRVTTAGLLPAWFLFALAQGRWRQLQSWPVVVGAVAYLGFGLAWVSLTSRFARYELAAGREDGISYQNLTYFAVCLPPLLCGSCLAAVGGALALLRLGRRSPAGLFWLSWLVSYTLFKLLMPTTNEPRHFVSALPGLACLAVCLGACQNLALVRRAVMPLVVAAGLAVNVYQITQLPRGLVGYGEMGRQVAALERPGNVLLACWEDQEFIFHYRASSPAVDRWMVRSDRSLAIRLPDYARVAADLQARTPQDVLGMIRRGRVRYVLTCCPDPGTRDTRKPEQVLLHEVARSRGADFRPRGEVEVLHQFERPGRPGRLFLWEFTGDLPEGPSEIPVVIPTAGMTLGANGR